MKTTSGPIRGADVLDWPGFEMRMGSAAQVGGRDAPRKRQEDSFVLNGLLLRYNYGKSGYPGDTACHTFARDRYLKLCSGYWNRPKGEPPLKPWNWSDPKVNQEYVRLALEYASKPGVGGYFWHDVTDAGWWYSYIDHFWSKRPTARPEELSGRSVAGRVPTRSGSRRCSKRFRGSVPA